MGAAGRAGDHPAGAAGGGPAPRHHQEPRRPPVGALPHAALRRRPLAAVHARHRPQPPRQDWRPPPRLRRPPPRHHLQHHPDPQMISSETAAPTAKCRTRAGTIGPWLTITQRRRCRARTSRRSSGRARAATWLWRL